MTHYGHWLGDIKRGEYNRQARFEPAHSLALALVPKAVSQRLNLELELAQSYLYGNPLPSPGGDGWVLMAIDGFSLGWGKRVNHVVKNLYPKGLRWISP
jgi:NOL1/NOP2/fmu family ribosome biogenesis protein